MRYSLLLIVLSLLGSAVFAAQTYQPRYKTVPGTEKKYTISYTTTIKIEGKEATKAGNEGTLLEKVVSATDKSAVIARESVLGSKSEDNGSSSKVKLEDKYTLEMTPLGVTSKVKFPPEAKGMKMKEESVWMDIYGRTLIFPEKPLAVNDSWERSGSSEFFLALFILNGKYSFKYKFVGPKEIGGKTYLQFECQYVIDCPKQPGPWFASNCSFLFKGNANLFFDEAAGELAATMFKCEESCTYFYGKADAETKQAIAMTLEGSIVPWTGEKKDEKEKK